MNEFRATISTDNEIESIERERERERERVIWAPLIRSRSFHHFQIQDPVPSISSPMRHDRKQYRETNINSSFIFRRQFHGRDHTTDSIFFSFFAFLFFFVLSSSAVLSPLRRGVDRAEKTFDSSVIVDPISRPSSNDTHLAHEQSRRRTFSFNVLFFIYFSLSTIPNVPPFHFYTPTIFCAFSA